MKLAALKQIIENGGATLNSNGQAVNFARGYQVSAKDICEITIKKANKILRVVNRLLKSVSASEFVGIWINNGVAFVDVSERIDKLSDAMNAGITRGQWSIYDWTMRRCIATR